MRTKTVVLKEDLSNPIYMDAIKDYIAMNEDYRIDDEVLSAMVTSARQTCEDYTGISIALRKLRYEIVTSLQELRKGTISTNVILDLPRPPLAYVESVSIRFVMSNETVKLVEGEDYVVTGNQIYLIDFDVESVLFEIKIVYSTGYGDKCPEAIKEVIKRLVHRGYAMKGTDLLGLTEDLAFRLAPYRVSRV